MEAARRVMEATGVKFNWDVQDAGVDVMEKHGTPLPDAVFQGSDRDRAIRSGKATVCRHFVHP